MKESKEYRLVLEELLRVFGDKHYITVSEIAKYDGICNRSVQKFYGIKGGCDICILAHKKCEMAKK